MTAAVFVVGAGPPVPVAVGLVGAIVLGGRLRASLPFVPMVGEGMDGEPPGTSSVGPEVPVVEAPLWVLAVFATEMEEALVIPSSLRAWEDPLSWEGPGLRIGEVVSVER